MPMDQVSPTTPEGNPMRIAAALVNFWARSAYRAMSLEIVVAAP
jgi:hypothetical protein